MGIEHHDKVIASLKLGINFTIPLIRATLYTVYGNSEGLRLIVDTDLNSYHFFGGIYNQF